MFYRIRAGSLPAAAVAFLIAMLVLAGCGGSNDDEPDINVSDVWSRPVGMMTGEMEMDAGEERSDDEETSEDPDKMEDDMEEMDGPTGVVYMTIENSGDAADTFLGASSDVAAVVELHESTVTDGVMQMRPVTTLEIPGDGTVVFEPGSYHVMLIGLKEALDVGDIFEVELEFEESGTTTVTSEVRDDR